MRWLPPAARRWSCAALALATVALVACSGVDEPGAVNSSVTEPSQPGRLARIQVVLQPPGETPGDEPALEVIARFVHYRGLDLAAVRARVDLPPLVIDRLRIGQCVASEQLWDPAEPVESASSTSASRELVLLDAGNVAVQIGDASIDLPLSLVPDLLPYMSGVAYDHVSEALPARAWPQGEPSPSALTITVEGAGDDELPGFSVRAPIPEAVALQATPSTDRGSLLLEWRPDGRGLPVVVRLSSFIGSEPAGDEITCLFSDAGSHRIDLDDLRAAGLDTSGDTLRIGTSRLARRRFDAGELFTREHAEAVVEVRSATFVTWP
ncbi:MAG: hypothetical protein H0T76_19190 [Nannocystis sp.]|nr:hypothetical protein [Nannocystis sp.]MBA3548615.1 hypothetical protein [Nannocystis sp.]